MELKISEFLDYSDQELAKWQKWVEEKGDEVLAIEPVEGADGPMKTVGGMLQHTFGTALWFSETIAGSPPTEWWNDGTERAADLFALAKKGHAGLRVLVETAPPEEWERVLILDGKGYHFEVTVRKAVLNALVHELRHLAQVALVVRRAGIAPPGEHDLILSNALG